MTRILTALLLAFALLFAGCTSDEPTDDPDPDDSETGNGGTDQSKPNPTGAMSVTTNNLTATFTITFAEVYGRTISYAIDGDGDGTADDEKTTAVDGPVTYTKSFTADGTYNATATASFQENGTQAIAINGVTFTVQAGGVSQSEPATSPAAPAESCAAPAAYDAAEFIPGVGEGSPTRVEFAVIDGTEGNAWTATFAFDVGSLMTFGFITDADGFVLESQSNTSPGMTTEVLLTGTVPASAAYVVLYGCGGPTSYSAAYESAP